MVEVIPYLKTNNIREAFENIKYKVLRKQMTIDTRYANLAQIGYTISYDNIKAVTNFMDKFQYFNIRQDIDDCYNLYSFIYTLSALPILSV